MKPFDSPAAQPQGGELLPCRVCGSIPVKGRWFREKGVAHCSKTSCFMFERAMTATEWNTLMARANLPRATATQQTIVEAIQGVQNSNDLDDGGFFEAGFIAAKTMIIDAVLDLFITTPRATGETVEAGHVLITETDNATYQRLVDLLLEEDYEPAGSKLDADDILKQIIAERDSLRAATTGEATVEAALPKPRLLAVEALEAIMNYFWGVDSPVLSEGEVQKLVEAALGDLKAISLDEGTLKWAAQWIVDSLTGETNERVIEFAENMAMTLRAATHTAGSVKDEEVS